MEAGGEARRGFRPSIQAVVLAGGEAVRMRPLSQATQKGLLPVANKPLICSQLELLAKAGLKDVIIVTVEEAADSMRSIAAGYASMDVAVEVSDETGTADVLRQIQPKLYTDFLVMTCDLLTDMSLDAVLDKHRVNQGALTVLFTRETLEDEKTKKKKKTEDYVIVDESSDALLMLLQKSEIKKDNFDVRRLLLQKYPRVSICNDLQDVHLYIFAHWVTDLLNQKPDFTSIKQHVVPFLLRKQYSMSEADLAAFPKQANGNTHDLAMQNSSQTPSWKPGPPGAEQLHCHRVVVEAAQVPCTRVSTLTAFGEANRLAARRYRPDDAAKETLAKLKAAWPRLVGSECVIGTGLVAKEGCSIKKSVVGNNCVLGADVKIVNCVLMNDITIEDGCSLSGVVVGSGARLGEKCQLKEGTVIAHRHYLVAGTEAKNEHYPRPDHM